MSYTISMALECLFGQPKRLREDAKQAAARSRRLRKVTPLKRLKDCAGDLSSWSDKITFEAKPGSPELKKIMAEFGGLWNKKWNENAGHWMFTRAEAYEGFNVTINVEKSESCKVEVQETTETYKVKKFVLIPGSCDPLTAGSDEV